MATLSVNQVVRTAGRKCYVCDKQMQKDEWFAKFTIVTKTKWGNTLESGVCVDCIHMTWNELCKKLGEQNA